MLKSGKYSVSGKSQFYQLFIVEYLVVCIID